MVKSLFYSFVFSLSIFSSSLCADVVWDLPAQTIATGSDEGAFDLAGNTATGEAWVAYGTAAGVFVEFYDGTTWQAPINISSDTSVNSLNIAIDSSTGNAAVVWAAGSPLAVKASTFNGSSWSAVQTISTPAQMSFASQIAYADGRAIAVWQNTTVISIQSAIFEGVSWTAPLVIDTASAQANSPQVAMDPTTGNAFAVYTYDNGGGVTVGASQFNGVSWSAPNYIAPPTLTFISLPQVAVSSTTGHAAAVWSRHNGSNLIVQAAFFNGTFWTSFPDLSASGQNAVQSQVVFFSSDDNFIASWSRFNGTNFVVQTSQFDGTSWSSALDISTSTNANLSSQLAANPSQQTAVLVWVDGTSPIDAVSFQNGAWSTIQALSSVPNTENARVVIDSSNTAIAAWQNFTGATFDIQAATGQASNPPSPPSNFTGRQERNRFPTETDLINILTWTPSTTPDVFYRLRRDGVIIAETTATLYKDHHRTPGVIYTYELTVVSADGESTPLIIQVP